MRMSISDDQKWACAHCTYLNFPSSQRCTICRQSKSSQLIIAYGPDTSSTSFSPQRNRRPKNFGDQEPDNESPNLFAQIDENSAQQQRKKGETLDIYQLASAADSSTMVTLNRIMHTSDEQHDTIWEPNVGKWTCPDCTYLNYPRSLKCTQCKRQRDISSTNSLTASAKSSRSGSIVHSGQHSPQALSEKAISPPPSIGKPTLRSPPPQTSSSSPSSSVLDSRLIAKKLQKWTCGTCTYENWPKATRCIMCYTSKTNGGNNQSGTVPISGKGNSLKGSNPQSPQPVISPPPGAFASIDIATTSSDGGNEKKRSHSSGKEQGRKSPKSSSSSESVNSDHSISVAGATASISAIHNAMASSSSAASAVPSFASISGYLDQQNETVLEKTMRRLKKQLRDVDYLWLSALKSIAADGLADCCDSVEAYLAAGGDPARVLSHGEAHIINRSIPGAMLEVGHTLFHLAICYRRDDLLTLLLACSDRPIGVSGRPIQRVPCHMSPESASEIRRQIHLSLRQRKGEVSAYFFTDLATFSLPSSIYDLPPSIQANLFDTLLDREVQKKLEEEYPIINWSVEVTDRLGSRLFALWNRMCGDCLLDSVLQATWGVFDSENSLRQALADSLSDAADVFYPRWREYEMYLANSLHYTIEEEQLAREWDLILQLASKPGAALEQAHIFVLAHIIRRPIIVYGVRVVKSYYSGESIDYARFEGIYVPLLWEPAFCWRSPICLSYTPGHFTALVPMEPDAYEIGAMAHVREFPQQPRFIYLPLKDSDGRPLPVHFLNANEMGHEQALLRTWLDVCVTEGGLWCCKQRIHRLSPSVQQMVDDWLDYYRRLSHLHQAASAALSRGGIGSGCQQISKSTKISNSRKTISPVIQTTTASKSASPGINVETRVKMESQQCLPQATAANVDTSRESGHSNTSTDKEYKKQEDVEKCRKGDASD